MTNDYGHLTLVTRKLQGVTGTMLNSWKWRSQAPSEGGSLCLFLAHSYYISTLRLHNKVPYTGWLKTIASQFWRIQVLNKGVGKGRIFPCLWQASNLWSSLVVDASLQSLLQWCSCVCVYSYDVLLFVCLYL